MQIAASERGTCLRLRYTGLALPTEHTSRAFETELRDLRAHLLAMSSRCELSVSLALEAFWTGAPASVSQAKALDAQIDADQMDIDALVLRVLALRQPVALDLRFLTTTLKLVTDLERIGDEALNIAERAEESQGDAGTLMRPELESMATTAQAMLRAALTCFVNGDADGAKLVILQDDEVDAQYHAIVSNATAHMTKAGGVPAGLRLVKVAKCLERIADHATNIAEAVVFMVRGEDVRHGKLRPAPLS